MYFKNTFWFSLVDVLKMTVLYFLKNFDYIVFKLFLIKHNVYLIWFTSSPVQKVLFLIIHGFN